MTRTWKWYALAIVALLGVVASSWLHRASESQAARPSRPIEPAPPVSHAAPREAAPRLRVRSTPPPPAATATLVTVEPGRGNVSGRVLDANGGAVSGARVLARAADSEGWDTATLSGADGRFELLLSTARVHVMAEAEAYSRATALVTVPDTQVVLLLLPASRLVGRVVARDDGEPLAGIDVTAVAVDGLLGDSRTVTTDAAGNFAMVDLAAGSYELQGVGEHWRTRAKRIELGVAEQGGPMLLEAVPAATLLATIRVGAIPCREGQAQLWGPTMEVQATTETGVVSFRGLLPGTYRVALECSAPSAQSTELTETIQLGSEASRHDWDLASGFSVSGTVVGPEGRPIALATVQVLPEAAEAASSALCKTDDGGAFECGGLSAGRYSLLVLDHDLADEVRVALGDVPTRRVSLRTLGSATLRVYVAPAGDGVPAVQQGHDLLAHVMVRREGDVPVTGSLQPDHVLFATLPLGEYTVQLGVADAAIGNSAHVNLTRDGQELTVTLSTPPSSSIRGRVLGADGEPAVDTWVHVSSSLLELASVVSRAGAVLTDTEGAFSFERLLPGKYGVSASNGGGASQNEVASPDGPELVLRIQPFASLSGKVITSEGGVVEQFELTCIEGATGETSVIGGSDGTWTLPDLRPGSYRLEVSSALGAAAKPVLLSAGQASSLDLVVQLPSGATESAALARSASARTEPNEL